MADPISLRPLEITDLPRVQNLAHDIWPECYKGILDDAQIPAMVKSLYALPALHHEIAVEGHRYWIAETRDRDLGFASAFQEGDSVWIKKLYLRAKTRGQGLGKRLITLISDAFPDTTRLNLYVNDGNAPAIAFYRSQGFEIIDTLAVQMGPYPFTDHIMSRPIPVEN
ncbi:GNAT family N-acetyltransferase [Asticcacaulis tiandongensis]|uniref:GNAT family N-acetyltransferase n=1 Tax=Asticcacaulis tiandongensis TaxID=2565365 RepID=UPI001FE538F4|nr:GNAT family N-acetyltransferase [Asticcacaulis tiandongensis]